MSRRTVRSGGAALLLAAGVLATVTGCAGDAACAPGESIPAPQGAATQVIDQGTVGVIDDVRIGFANSGCSSGSWRAGLTIIEGDVTTGALLEIGSAQPIEEGRSVVLLSGGDDGGWVEVALVTTAVVG